MWVLETHSLYGHSIFKDISFLEVLNWFTVYSQTEICVEIIFTSRDW